MIYIAAYIVAFLILLTLAYLAEPDIRRED